ncbi:MAG: amidohydrolase [Desulfovibrionaceae bacterium]|nr:amidohydrolase [Desulfovibrionaceae bacterium]
MIKNLTRREFIKISSWATLGFLVAGSDSQAGTIGRGKPADTIIYGNFYTVDEKNPKAEAVAIKDGKFVYVGLAQGVKDYIGQNTKEHHYTKGVIMPGFVDGHAHGHLGGSKMLLMCALNGCKTIEKIRETLKEFIAKHPEMDRIQGIGWDDATFGVNGPTAAMIDDLTDKPISLIDYGHHSYWLNSAAMKLKNITKDTPDVSDGVIVRDAKGNPTGCFREGAKIYFEDLIYHFSVEQYKKAILCYQDVFLSLGLTMTFDPMVNLDYGSENVMEAYRQLDAEGKLKIRAHGGYQVFADKNPVADVEHAVKLREKFKGKRFVIDNIKILLDGVLESRTAYLNEPYSDSKDGYRGMLRFDTDTLADTVKKANELNITIHIHTIGDGAVTKALDAFEKAASTPDKRNAITHMQLIKPADIDRMAKLKVVAVANSFWFTKEPDYHEKLSIPYLGKERAENQYPMKSLWDKGIVVSQATDYPVTTDVNPLIGLQYGVMRQVPGEPESLLNPKERVTLEQMIKAATLNGAYELKCEDSLGSIAVGKEADLVALNADITVGSPEKITDAKVLGTMIGGEWVYIAK